MTISVLLPGAADPSALPVLREAARLLLALGHRVDIIDGEDNLVLRVDAPRSRGYSIDATEERERELRAAISVATERKLSFAARLRTVDLSYAARRDLAARASKGTIVLGQKEGPGVPHGYDNRFECTGESP